MSEPQHAELDPESRTASPADAPAALPTARGTRSPGRLLVRTRTDADRIEWDALAPRGAYARYGAPCLQAVLLAVCIPLGLVLALPVAAANAICQRSLHRVLFAQERIGRRGRPFRILKFRTMCEVHSSQFESWGGGREQLRVTRFGRFLRNSHLDELPQLVNVLRGEMNLIGPRPEMREIEDWAASEVPGFSERLAVRPGITGLAQVTQGYVGRDAPGYAGKHALGMRYLREKSLGLDLWILARTAATMLRLRGWRWDPTPAPGSPSGAPRVPTPNRVWD